MHLVFRHQKQVRQVFSTWSSSDQCNLKNQTVCNGNQLSFFKSVWLATKVYYLFYLAVVHISLTLFSGTVFLASLFQFSISLLFHSLTLFQPALVGRQQLSGNCTEYCLFAFFFNFFLVSLKLPRTTAAVSACLPACLKPPISCHPVSIILMVRLLLLLLLLLADHLGLSFAFCSSSSRCCSLLFLFFLFFRLLPLIQFFAECAEKRWAAAAAADPEKEHQTSDKKEGKETCARQISSRSILFFLEWCAKEEEEKSNACLKENKIG